MAEARASVYGKYSLGSGAIVRDPDRVWNALADPEVVAAYRASISGDLDRAGIPISALKDWHVMDVGTGRQALAFLQMGAQRVDHFDLASENVAAVSAHIATMPDSDRLTTTCCDLVSADLGREQFDFIYLNGIVQHFSDVGRGIVNCIRALKPRGLMWLYFYRSGSFDQFITYSLRRLVAGANVVRNDALMREYDAAARFHFSDDLRRSYLTSAFMDGVFTPYARVYSVATYLTFAAECGLEMVASSGLDPADKHVDHLVARGAGVVTLRRVSDVPHATMLQAARALAPEREVNQLEPALYSDAEIARSLALVRDLQAMLAASEVPRSMTVFSALRIFAFLMQKTKAPGYEATFRHRDLQALLTGMLAMLRDDFGVGVEVA